MEGSPPEPWESFPAHPEGSGPGCFSWPDSSRAPRAPQTTVPDPLGQELTPLTASRYRARDLLKALPK